MVTTEGKTFLTTGAKLLRLAGWSALANLKVAGGVKKGSPPPTPTAPQAEPQQYRRGRSLRSTPNRLHLHVASKKSLRIPPLLPYIEWLHLYRWGKGVSGLSREVGICGTGDLVCPNRGAASQAAAPALVPAPGSAQEGESR